MAAGRSAGQGGAAGGGLRVAVIGTGLVGASLGMALGRLDTVEEVVGYDRDPRQLALAVRRGAASRSAASPADAVTGADVVVLAVPVSAIPAVAAEVAAGLRAGAILTDVGSVKGRVVGAMEAAVRPGVHVVGGHPMAGSHENGAAHATAELFVGATYLLTPTPRTDPGAYRRLHGLVGAVGARVLAVSPDRHDALVAVVSHLPQLAATTLMNLAAERAQDEHAGLLLLAAGGFRDATRTCGSTSARRTGRRLSRCSMTTASGSVRSDRSSTSATRGACDGRWPTRGPPGAPCPASRPSPVPWSTCSCPSPTARACSPR
jgi:prephenate dehydrogenase